MGERPPLDPAELQPVFRFYEVRVLVDPETATIFRRLPWFSHVPEGQRTFLWSSHRVGPKKLFGLSRQAFPDSYQIEQADYESQRVAQKVALELIQLAGVLTVNVSWELRKATNSRYTPGQTITGPVASLRSTDDRWIDGEPSELALAIDQGREE